MSTSILKVAGISIAGLVGISTFALVAKLALAPLNMAHTAVNSATGVVNKTLDPNNVIVKYEWFHDANAQYQSRLNQIHGHKALIAGETDKGELQRLRIELAAMQQSCRDLAFRYNANATKTNVGLFQGETLPRLLDATTCEG
ncbi:hypothetical protein [Magnetospirillum molischianum]|uniref:Uncharacterized protein n=1 Tax=Magnetospirillum molischianum DSM 120 TaxID=1150626 RepID=H8FYD2_MAGML|nr:hypothetical protein [Magnetospirillum molischianum]CCG43370.1 exported hypothetical protein [Magnetospirillum molischianum DSM 120]